MTRHISLLLCVVAFSAAVTVAADLRVGDRAPDLGRAVWENPETAPTMSSLRGRVVLIEMWGIACPPCLASLPDLRKFYEREHDNGLRVFTFHVQDDEELARAYYENNEYPMPISFDRATARWFMVSNSLPQCLVIDREGRVVFTGHPKEGMKAAKRELDHPGSYTPVVTASADGGATGGALQRIRSFFSSDPRDEERPDDDVIASVDGAESEEKICADGVCMLPEREDGGFVLRAEEPAEPRLSDPIYPENAATRLERSERVERRAYVAPVHETRIEQWRSEPIEPVRKHTRPAEPAEPEPTGPLGKVKSFFGNALRGLRGRN